jgi:pimeloyl-ACP methyl ester carboxylesterase
MATFHHDGLAFHHLDVGQGIPFFFQHGLGGDVQQPAGLFRPPPGIRFLSFDCRAHGQTRPMGDEARVSISAFADDLLALMEHLDLKRAVVGGISMGAAVALNFALRHPDRVMGLVLSRPAWLDRPREENARIYALIASLIRMHGAQRGLLAFEETGEYRETLASSPDAAASLIAQFEGPRAEEVVVRLERIPADAPCRDLRSLEGIRTPALVLANRQDPIHPYEYGETLARMIRGAELHELTPKSVSRERHAEEVQALIGRFLQEHFADPASSRSVAC